MRPTPAAPNILKIRLLMILIPRASATMHSQATPPPPPALPLSSPSHICFWSQAVVMKNFSVRGTMSWKWTMTARAVTALPANAHSTLCPNDNGS
jgi:hypothetical protein